MGGGGGLLGGVTGALFGSPSQPATPDYSGAAQATAQGNLDAARAATAANRVNQVTPYGSLNYAVTGQDPYGNPTWTATSSLSPDQQALYDYDIASSKGLGQLQSKGLNYVGQMIDQPFSTSSLPSLTSNLNAPQFTQLGSAEAMQRDLENQGMAGWDKATGLLMQRLEPSLDRQQKALDTQLANQGIMRGSEAYNQAQQDLAQKQNDLRNQAALGGQQVQQNLFGQSLQAGQFGNTAMQQDYANRQAQLQMNNALAQQGFGNQATQAELANRARGQGFQELAYQRNEPINTLNAVRSGSQVTTPNQFYVNAPQQATTAGADMLGAAGMTGNAAIAQANAENANRNAMMQGLFSLGGAAMMSDIRTKENIKYLGDLTNGLPFYEFEYKSEFKAIGGEGKFIGVMAQDVEKVQPEAVIELPSGYKMVNYGALQ
jgi:hypothetical protein